MAQRLKLVLLLLVIAAVCSATSQTTMASSKGEYSDLVALLDEFIEFKDPAGDQPRQIIRDVAGQAIDPVADHSEQSIAEQTQKVLDFQKRLDGFDVTDWNRSQRTSRIEMETTPAT